MKSFEEPFFSGEHVLSDVLPHLHNDNSDNAHKLFVTSSQNSTFSFKQENGTHDKNKIDYRIHVQCMYVLRTMVLGGTSPNVHRLLYEIKFYWFV